MLSTSKLTLTSGPVVVEKSTVTCLDTVPALALGKCTVVGRDYYSNIVPSTRENAQLFVGVVTNYYGNPPGGRSNAGGGRARVRGVERVCGCEP